MNCIAHIILLILGEIWSKRSNLKSLILVDVFAEVAEVNAEATAKTLLRKCQGKMYFRIVTSTFYLPQQKMLKFKGCNKLATCQDPHRDLGMLDLLQFESVIFRLKHIQYVKITYACLTDKYAIYSNLTDTLMNTWKKEWRNLKVMENLKTTRTEQTRFSRKKLRIWWQSHRKNNIRSNRN